MDPATKSGRSNAVRRVFSDIPSEVSSRWATAFIYQDALESFYHGNESDSNWIEATKDIQSGLNSGGASNLLQAGLADDRHHHVGSTSTSKNDTPTTGLIQSTASQDAEANEGSKLRDARACEERAWQANAEAVEEEKSGGD
ncbi:hypothetical protein F4780DRAFT_779087 [Xylariomycetidae sp. FL0641]|nr:hypothetical protein F4780DRAFT_779087 [Xylariomycetidae sp. FL0641]